MSLQTRLNQALVRRLTKEIAACEYKLKWKVWDGWLPGLRASGRRTSASDCGGWLTPVANDDNKSVEAHLAMKERMGERDGSGGNRTSITSLQVMAKAAGWVTPSSRDWKDTPGMATTGTNPDGTSRMRVDQLPRQAAIAGYPTPNARDYKGAPGAKTTEAGNFGGSLPRTANTLGQTPSGSPAQTEKRGALNPELSRWLMGFPSRWDQEAPCKGSTG